MADNNDSTGGGGSSGGGLKQQFLHQAPLDFDGNQRQQFSPVDHGGQRRRLRAEAATAASSSNFSTRRRWILTETKGVMGPGSSVDEGEDEAEIDGEGEGEVEGPGEGEVESEAEAHDIEAESEGERFQSSQEREISDQRVESEGKDAETEEEGYGHWVVSSRRREVIASESEGYEDNRYGHDSEDEVDQARKPMSPGEQNDQEVVRDVFGDSDEDEQAEFGARNEVEQDLQGSHMEEEGSYEKDLRPEDIVPDENAHYESVDENLDQKSKENPIGPPLDLEIPLGPPPG